MSPTVVATPPPFFQAYADGTPRRFQIGLAVVRAGFAGIMAGAYFLGWHIVHKTNAGEALGCIFSADCHAGPSGPVHDTGESFVCTGYLHFHGSVVVPVLAVALAGVALSGLLRFKLRWILLFEVVGLGLCAGVVYSALTEILAHMFDREEPLLGEGFSNVSFMLIVMSYVLGPAVQCLLVARSRREAAGARLES